MFEKIKSIRMALCLLALSFLVLCGFVTTRDEKYVSYFLHLYSAGLFREQNFTLHDAKAIFGKDHIHRIEMRLSCYKAMPLESARKLVASVATDFLDKINNDPGLKEKGLIKEKFIPRQLYLRIMCDNVVGETYETIYIREIVLDKGQLTYVTFQNMPEFWGKSYTIHEDFDYALMLVGSARPPEDIIAETVIVPQVRAFRGDTCDAPVRDHEELLYTGRELSKERLEPVDSAPPPVSPYVASVEQFSQLNLPPRPKIEDQVTPIEQEMAPPVPPAPTESAVKPVEAAPVPTQPTQAPKPVKTTPVEKSVSPSQEAPAVVAPTMAPAAGEVKTPVQEVVPESAPQTVPEAAPEQVPVPVPAPAPIEQAPVTPEATPQMPQRLKQSQGEAQKLLSIYDAPVDEPMETPQEEQIPTMPEASQVVADNDQIDFFALFDSFAAQSQESISQPDEVIQDDDETVVPNPEDNSTPPDQNFEMPEYEYSEPPAGDQQAPEVLIADNDDVEEIEEKSDDASDTPDVMPDTQKEQNSAEENTTERALQEPLVEQDIVEQDIVADVEQPVSEDQESSEPSWWNRLFTKQEQTVDDAVVAGSSIQPLANEGVIEKGLPSDESPETMDQPIEPQVQNNESDTPQESWWARLFSSQKNNEAENQDVAIQDVPSEENSQLQQGESIQESPPAEAAKDESQVEVEQQAEMVEEVEPQLNQESSQESFQESSWWDRMFGSKNEEPNVPEASITELEEVQTDSVEPQATMPAQPEQRNEVVPDVPSTQEAPQELALVEDDVERAEPETQPEEPQASWWDRLFKKDEAAKEEAATDEVALVEDDVTLPEPEAQSEAQPEAQSEEEPQASWWNRLFKKDEAAKEEAATDEVALVEDDVTFPEPEAQSEAQPEAQSEEEPQASWWNRLFKKDEAAKEEAATDEVALVEDDVTFPEPEAQSEAQPEAQLEEEPQASWWDRLFKKDEAAKEEAATDEVALVEDDVTLPEPEAESEAQSEEEPQASWWNRLFKKDEAAKEEAATDEVALVEDDVTLPEPEAQSEAQSEEEPQASWWNRLFKKDEAAKEEAATDEVALVEDDVTLPEPEAQPEAQSEEEPQASWWNRLFKKDEAAKEEAAADEVAFVEDDVTLPEPEAQSEAQSEEEPQASWWNRLFKKDEAAKEEAATDEVALVEDDKDLTQPETHLETQPEETKDSLWNRFFVSKTASGDQPDEAPTQPDSSTVEPENNSVVVIDESQTNPPPKSSWWEGFFRTKDPDVEEEPVRYDPEPATYEEAVPNTESAEDWWRRVFAEKQQEDKEKAERKLNGNDGLSEEPQTIASATEEDDGDNEDNDAAFFPTIASEHVEIDTDEAIGKDEPQGDPVLKLLYSEPLSWMQTRSSQPAEGSWSGDSEEAEADEPIAQIDSEEELIYEEDQ